MSYDITLNDPVTHETIELQEPHAMRGGTYAVGGTREAWLNITYNYGRYYHEATEGDEEPYGIRAIYGKTGAQSIPILDRMIRRIEQKYRDENGDWIKTVRRRERYYDSTNGKELTPYDVFLRKDASPYRKEEFTETVSEGPDEDYWEPTAGNALRPLYQLKAMATMRPDGIWDGD